MTSVDQLKDQVIQLLTVELAPTKMPDTDELQVSDLSQLINKHLKKIVIQKKEQDAVFSSMSEGVLAIGKNKKIKNINLAAARLFNINKDNALEKYVDEVIKIDELLKFFVNALDEKVPREKEMTLSDGPEVFLQVKSSPLLSSDGEVRGAVFVLNDITRLKKLESHRRDFVANVSHELRTPLTSIQGFSETLLNLKLENADEQQKFLKIIHKHAARLGAVIEDLLALSRLERGTESDSIQFSVERILPVLRSSIELCSHKAEAKQVKIRLTHSIDCKVRMNSHLLEQAFFNLIDNSIKYSPVNETIDVEMREDKGFVYITIADHGCGMEPHHLPRLFERFYRVDKSRSRDQGGTGLGLAIVKHVCLAHSGNVSVDSKVGTGSEFTIQLPISK